MAKAAANIEDIDIHLIPGHFLINTASIGREI
jgi:hypothetical protein